MSEAIQAIDAPSPSEHLRDLFWRMKRSRIRMSPPSPNTRASSIGHPCDRHTYYERTLPAEQRVSHSPELQAIFDLGNELEKYAFRELEDMGVSIVRRGRDFSDAKLHISGHVDADIILPGRMERLPVEVKGLNPVTAGSIRTINDIRDHRQAFVRKYWSQLQLYLYFEGAPLGVFALLDKSSGRFQFIDCHFDYDHVESLLKKAERIQLAVVANSAPAKNQSGECNRCQFAAVCCPDLDYGAGASILDDPDLESKIARREEISPLATEYDALDKEIKDRLPEKEGQILLGDWVITRKQTVKRAEAKPRAGYTYYRTDIRKLK